MERRWLTSTRSSSLATSTSQVVYLEVKLGSTSSLGTYTFWGGVVYWSQLGITHVLLRAPGVTHSRLSPRWPVRDGASLCAWNQHLVCHVRSCPLLGTHWGTGGSTRVLVTTDRPALVSTALLGRPLVSFPGAVSMPKVDTTCKDLRFWTIKKVNPCCFCEQQFQ